MKIAPKALSIIVPKEPIISKAFYCCHLSFWWKVYGRHMTLCSARKSSRYLIGLAEVPDMQKFCAGVVYLSNVTNWKLECIELIRILPNVLVPSIVELCIRLFLLSLQVVHFVTRIGFAYGTHKGHAVSIPSMFPCGNINIVPLTNIRYFWSLSLLYLWGCWLYKLALIYERVVIPTSVSSMLDRWQLDR